MAQKKIAMEPAMPREAASAALRLGVLAAIEQAVPGCPVQLVLHDGPLREQLDLDSLDWLNVIDALGDRLSIDIPQRDRPQLRTLDSIVDYLASRQVPRADLRSPAGQPADGADAHAVTQHQVNDRLVRIRPMRADDKPLEAAFVRHLSATARYQRFMVTMRELPEAKLDYLTAVDQVRHVALVATIDADVDAGIEAPGRELEVGVARYIVDAGGAACEFAVVVDDQWQGSGLAGILMHRLIAIARERGLARMEGLVLKANTGMRKLARQLGFEETSDPQDKDTVRVSRSLSRGQHARSGPGT